MTTTKSYFRKPLALVVLAALGASMLLLLASPAWAAAITVNTTADNVTEDDLCSLREAITTANSDTPVGVGGAGNDCVTGSGADTISFDPSLTGQTITLGSQLPAITAAGGALTIDGESANITISGGGSVRVFVVDGGNLTLNNLTVADGSSDLGGGIINQGTLTVTNSTFSGNSTDRSGGGIFNGTNGMLTVTNSTFSGNSANTGGGIYNNTAGMLTVTNSTFSGNSGVNGPGAIRNFEGTVTLSNTIVANSTAVLLGNCAGPITDAGGNLDDGTTCGFTASTSKSNTPAGLDPAGLQPNGGPTNTIALQGDSAAIDAAVNCPPPTTDQRGVSRPQGSACDIGAYEVEVAVDNTAPFVTETSPLQLKKTDNVTAEFSEPVKNVTTETFILERKVAVKKNTPPKFEPVLASVSPASGEVGVGGLATLNPAQDLPKGEYRATITTEVTDLADNKLDQDQDPNNGNQPKVWTFTVAK